MRRVHNSHSPRSMRSDQRLLFFRLAQWSKNFWVTLENGIEIEAGSLKKVVKWYEKVAKNGVHPD